MFVQSSLSLFIASSTVFSTNIPTIAMLSFSYTSLDKEEKKQVFYELKYPTFIKRKRPGESKQSRLARRAVQRAKEMKQREEEEHKRSELKQPKQIMAIQSNPKEVTSYVGRYLLGSGPKYIPIRGSDRKLKKPLSTTPRSRSHNYRMKALIATNKQKNYYNNKSASYKSQIYNFSVLFSNNPVSFGMSIHALAAPTKRFSGKSKKKKKSHLLGWCGIARMAKRQDLIERVLIKTLYQEEGV